MFINTRFPQRYERGAIARPVTNDEVVVTDGGFDQINERWAYPRHDFEFNLVPTRTDDVDYIALRELYYQARTAHSFLFRDWNDYQLTDEVIGVGDGATTVFQIVKHYGTTTVAGGRRVARVTAVTVELDGVGTGAYELDDATGVITFDAAPGVGVVITVSCEFDVEVHFAQPIDFQGLDYRTRHAQAVVLREVKTE